MWNPEKLWCSSLYSVSRPLFSSHVVLLRKRSWFISPLNTWQQESYGCYVFDAVLFGSIVPWIHYFNVNIEVKMTQESHLYKKKKKREAIMIFPMPSFKFLDTGTNTWDRRTYVYKCRSDTDLICWYCVKQEEKNERKNCSILADLHADLTLNVNQQHQEWEGKHKGKSIILEMLSVYYWKMKSLVWYGLWGILSHSLLLCIW